MGLELKKAYSYFFNFFEAQHWFKHVMHKLLNFEYIHK
jgi:hypothetical protein